VTVTWQEALDRMPLVAILRGLEPNRSENVCTVLIEAGFRIIEVPLNSPQPLQTISRLADRFGDEVLIGAGTVLTTREANDVAAAGGRLVVMPNCDPAVIRAAKDAGCAAVPGVMTPSEAFAALAAGADALKLFPAEILPPKVVKALRAVLPPDTDVLPVGGVTPEAMADYWAAGASGFGLGSALFKPDRPVAEIAAAADRFIAAVNRLRG
jgi:2-dehydro-3-deoxyphosphogalactonate aldolase